MQDGISLVIWGTISRVEGVNFILNIFGGIVANASRAISYQVKNALQTLVNDITVVFQPQSMMVFFNR